VVRHKLVKYIIRAYDKEQQRVEEFMEAKKAQKIKEQEGKSVENK